MEYYAAMKQNDAIPDTNLVKTFYETLQKGSSMVFYYLFKKKKTNSGVNTVFASIYIKIF